MIRRAIALATIPIILCVACISVTNGSGYDRHDSEDGTGHGLTFDVPTTQGIAIAVANGDDPSVVVQITDWPEAQNVWSWMAGHNEGNVIGIIRALRPGIDRLYISWYTGGCGGTCYTPGVVQG